MVTEPVTDGEAFGVQVSLQVRGACKPTSRSRAHRPSVVGPPRRAKPDAWRSRPRGSRCAMSRSAAECERGPATRRLRGGQPHAGKAPPSPTTTTNEWRHALWRFWPVFPASESPSNAVTRSRQRQPPLRGPTYGPFIAVWRAGANQTRCKARRARQCKHWQFAAWRKRIVMTPRLPWIMSLVALAAGCATQSGLPPKSEASASSGSASHAHDVAELRHFYLLSPGPNETMVVTRSDLSDH